METSGEDDGTALLVTANGLVPMPKIDLEFGSRRSDQVKYKKYSAFFSLFTLFQLSLRTKFVTNLLVFAPFVAISLVFTPFVTISLVLIPFKIV